MDSAYTQGSYDTVGLPCGRWSLWDMMNFSLALFAKALEVLTVEARRSSMQSPVIVIPEAEKERIMSQMQFVAERCRQLALSNTQDRLLRCFSLLQRTTTYGDLNRELITLYEAIEDDTKEEYFYHYPRVKVMVLIEIAEWLPIFDAFPSARNEIDAGLDCYALGHPTACVFHMMRAAELGMRALARERQVTFPRQPLEWTNWQNILEVTEKNAKMATTGMRSGPAKDAALAFYNGAIAHLHALKDMYRNSVMHMRRSYDDLEAQQAMVRVRDFMTGLSRKIGEKTKKPIRKWP
jgi:hypothetical protein